MVRLSDYDRDRKRSDIKSKRSTHDFHLLPSEAGEPKTANYSLCDTLVDIITRCAEFVNLCFEQIFVFIAYAVPGVPRPQRRPSIRMNERYHAPCRL